MFIYINMDPGKFFSVIIWCFLVFFVLLTNPPNEFVDNCRCISGIPFLNGPKKHLRFVSTRPSHSINQPILTNTPPHTHTYIDTDTQTHTHRQTVRYSHTHKHSHQQKRDTHTHTHLYRLTR